LEQSVYFTLQTDSGIHDHHSYLCCLDMLSMVGDPLLGNGCGSLNNM